MNLDDNNLSPLSKALGFLLSVIVVFFVMAGLTSLIFPNMGPLSSVFVMLAELIVSILLVAGSKNKPDLSQVPPPTDAVTVSEEMPTETTAEPEEYEEEAIEPPPYIPEYIAPAPAYRTFQCRFCGSDMPVGSRFCNTCGASTSADFFRQATTKRHTCRRCRSQNVKYEALSESTGGGGCLTALFYLILALTIWGLLIIIPLMLRKKTRTVTYAVCQDCGYRWRVY